MNLLSLPIEILGHIFEDVVTAPASEPETRAETAAIQRHVLPPVCQQFDVWDQAFFLSKDKQIDFEHTQAAITRFATTCPPTNLGNTKFRNDVHALLKRNASIAVNFSVMSINQRAIFLDVFEKGNKSGEFRIKDLKIEHTNFLPELKNLGHLHSLEINNSNIQSLWALERLESLESLTISSCPNLTVFPAMKNLSSTLRALDIEGCSRMTSLQGLVSLKTLQSLRIKALHNITNLPTLIKLQSLQDLQIIKCQKLKILPDLNALSALKTLKIAKCQLLQKWPGLTRVAAPPSFQINGVEIVPRTNFRPSLSTSPSMRSSGL